MKSEELYEYLVVELVVMYDQGLFNLKILSLYNESLSEGYILKHKRKGKYTARIRFPR